ncbi:MAG TPA: rhamnulokinase family protein [Pseudonocardiaceae bacterium]|nr:rhamnulokinase family protein [Pseudonocardiaceae bacterium]
MSSAFAAIDLGASSGRVMLADVDASHLELRAVHRFPNRPVSVGGTLYWDILALWADTVEGLRMASRQTSQLAGIGVDSWAIDYALLDGDGRLLGNPVHYRDTRTDGIADTISSADLYATTGVQVLPFNTIFQWVAARDSTAMRSAAHALLIPDLFSYWLTGRLGTELTNASTTGLLDVRSHRWSTDLFDRLRLRGDLFPPIRQPGERIGAVRNETALGDVPVFTVGSHDTASAVVGVPARDERFAYISCGTWSLVGVELDGPIITDAARAANFGNELGVDDTVRFLRNVMGLWLLQESIRTWEAAGQPIDQARLLAAAERVPAGRFVVDPDRPEFLFPGDIPARLRAECRRTGQPVPETPAEIARCVHDSLAAAYRRAVHTAGELSGRTVDAVHIVGGGARNALLCQLTADQCEIPVIAGPVEATAIGNVLVQARAAGVLLGGVHELRNLVRGKETTTYHPRPASVRSWPL